MKVIIKVATTRGLGEDDSLDLIHEQSFGQAGDDRVGVFAGKQSGHELEGAADSMDSERVQRVVISEDLLELQQARKGTMPATIPMIMAPLVVMKPQAGVTTTRPATTPSRIQEDAGLPLMIHSATPQTKLAVAAARVVVVNAWAAIPGRGRCRH